MTIDPKIKQKAEDIRNKIYGKEVRESLASGIEAMSEDVVSVTERQDTVETQFQAVIDETTDKDVISAPEVILARGGAQTLGERLDSEKAEFTAQLAQTATKTGVNIFGETKIVAHRGLSGIAPENTIPAYVAAGKAKVWAVETDVQRTLDGKWVLMHDMDVNRMTNGTGFVKDLTLNHIKSLNIDAGVNIGLYPNLKVPTLEEFLATCKQYNIVPLIEVKSLFIADDCNDLVNVIINSGFEENSIILSADLRILWEVRKYSKKIHCQYMTPITETSLTHIINMGNASSSEDHNGLTKAKIDMAHAMNIRVSTWTVNSYETARSLIEYGVDMLSSDIITEIKF